MSEPFWTPLSAMPVDYEGSYNPASQYVPGDIVRYNGVDYLCVNPALGQTPPLAQAPGVPLVTALPGSPVDGQEVILVDSLTAPTYSWRLRYVAAKASDKWLFIGGSAAQSEVETEQTTASTSYTDLATAGPSVVIPVAGLYVVEQGFECDGTGNQRWMSYAIGGTAAVDADSVKWDHASGLRNSPFRAKRKQLGAVTVTAKYRTNGGGGFGKRMLRATPVAVGG